MNVKVKLSSIDLIEITDFLDQMEVPQTSAGILIGEITVPAMIYQELNDLLKTKINRKELTKLQSVKVPESYCLVFFFSFAGPADGRNYKAVAIKNFCRQIEDLLFKSGRFKAPQNPNFSLVTLIN